ncbi:iron uptake transporter deferrochelatase/peroxidase subunit [Schumannella sp. 10F1B-5-1]|uniref:iron uptake transporter deferrochelatase/peroxidase subunit n=1 Tax=Schumannella sp. 10F1B-5-1 TaxID=2590780 RepID=UPI00112FE9B5|nr:iron uptake transporter deferrochelatase/peroxidase subunit [Schumannella sp. 10F1B-5-1]TPW73124.1 deferrochelatase/peroxidase EfeB [Schumannella sp. 10F1B-5-1]
MTDDESGRGLSRRGLLGLAGAGAAGLALGGAGGAAVAAGIAGAAAANGTSTVYPFHGEHQAGISTPAQDRLHFAVFDVDAGASRDDLIQLLKDWTAAARRMTAGDEVGGGAVDGSPLAPPDDTGEALGLPASGLTLTFGFGPTLFTSAEGDDRFGLADRRPPELEALPRFRGDALVPQLTGGDLCIQACADDPQVAVHAIRNLSRIAFGTASLRWSQLGFGRTSSTSTSQATPRNLFGFKDGTANVKAEEQSALAENVWVGAKQGPEWMVGGSYLVARKIRMVIESWDRTRLEEQERVIGRSKGEGAPLSGGTEFTEPDFTRKGATDAPLIDRDAHVRLAHPDVNDGIRLLRRGYNYVDGNDSLGRLDAGLFFLSYQSDPAHFVTVQRSLASDALNEYLKHVGSAVFAIPAGVAEGAWIGRELFG